MNVCIQPHSIHLLEIIDKRINVNAHFNFQQIVGAVWIFGALNSLHMCAEELLFQSVLRENGQVNKMCFDVMQLHQNK